MTICVPARNEEPNIAACVEALRATDGVAELEILVLDDGSSDSTAAIVEDIARDDARVRLMRGAGSVPEGWLGKPNASQQLFERASGHYLVFVDADVRLQPEAIRCSIDLLERHRLDLVSPYPRQLAPMLPERVVQPLLQWLWLTFLPLRLAERARPVSMVAANGQFMVTTRAVMQSVNGFESVRAEVLDDVALGRALKRAGQRVAVVDGTELAMCRMYDSWAALRDGYTKNLWSATGTPAGAVGLGAVLAYAYLVPPAAGLVGAFTGRRMVAVLGTSGYLAGVLGRFVSARTTGGSPGDAAMHPASIATLLGLIVRSWRKHLRGDITWKGRRL